MSRVVSEGDARVVVQKAISSGPSSFAHFFDANASFVDKTLVIEAFLRSSGSHHLILRPRRSGKSYTLSMISAFLQRPLRFESHHVRDITTSQFQLTAIAGPEYHDLVSTHFQQYPVLYIDLKDVVGVTFEDMLICFDTMINEILDNLSNPLDGIQDQNFVHFCQQLRNREVLQRYRMTVLDTIARQLWRFFGKPVVVLIDEYDSPMHSAIEDNYLTSANNFFARVFSSLLKNNEAVYASMMVGICRVVKPGWISDLNHLDIFPMHAADDRYAKFFLFTEPEVKILCDVHGKLSIEALRAHYNGYAARCDDGLVKLYNPVSVVRALEKNKILNYWVETGRNSPLSQLIWRSGPGFRDNLDLLLTRKSVKLVIDVPGDINFLTYDDLGLWDLLYYTGYLTIQDFRKHLTSEYIFRIPNEEVTSEWHEWVVNYLKANDVTTLAGVYHIIMAGGAERFQKQFTAFLQESRALFCAPHQKEKVSRALCYMLIFALFGQGYGIEMEHTGHGRWDIMAHPFSPQGTLSLIFWIKTVARHETSNGRQSLKTPNCIANDLEQAKIEALTQIEERCYRGRVPLHAKKVHEYAFVFCGKFCVAAVRTFERNVMGDWEQVAIGTTGVSECMVDVGDEDV